MAHNHFDPDDITQICSHRNTVYRMKKDDYKELIRNVQLGSIDLIVGVLKAIGLIITSLPEAKKPAAEPDGYREGHSGYGLYIGDFKQNNDSQ